MEIVQQIIPHEISDSKQVCKSNIVDFKKYTYKTYLIAWKFYQLAHLIGKDFSVGDNLIKNSNER